MVFIFFSIHDLIQAEGLLKEKGFLIKVLPLPPEMASGCGMGLVIQVEDPLLVTRVLQPAGLVVRAVYREEDGGYKRERD